jgi:dTDP-4-dehydrorhamnose 3,5-epimerase
LGHYNKKAMTEVGIRDEFVQDNQSFSCRNVLRGLHYQARRPQSAWWPTKFFDVAVGSAPQLTHIWTLARCKSLRGKQAHALDLSGPGSRAWLTASWFLVFAAWAL